MKRHKLFMVVFFYIVCFQMVCSAAISGFDDCRSRRDFIDFDTESDNSELRSYFGDDARAGGSVVVQVANDEINNQELGDQALSALLHELLQLGLNRNIAPAYRKAVLLRALAGDIAITDQDRFWVYRVLVTLKDSDAIGYAQNAFEYARQMNYIPCQIQLYLELAFNRSPGQRERICEAYRFLFGYFDQNQQWVPGHGEPRDKFDILLCGAYFDWRDNNERTVNVLDNSRVEFALAAVNYANGFISNARRPGERLFWTRCALKAYKAAMNIREIPNRNFYAQAAYNLAVYLNDRSEINRILGVTQREGLMIVL